MQHDFTGIHQKAGNIVYLLNGEIIPLSVLLYQVDRADIIMIMRTRNDFAHL